MVNVNIKRITIAGQIVRVMETQINGIYTYKVGIQKVDGGVWVVNISEDLYFKTRGKESIFELAMVFKNDDMYGKVNTELSKVEAVYIKGTDISDEEYAAQQELDKSWLMTPENLQTIHVKKKRSIFKAFILIFLIAAGLTYFAISSWISNVRDYRQYEDYVMVEGIITDRNYTSNTEKYWYDVEYVAEDGKTYTHREDLDEIDSSMPKIGDDIPIIYNPENYDDVYIGMHKLMPDRYVPARYASIAPSYLLGIMAIAFDLGAIALILMTKNKTASKYFRLLIPISLIVFSVITAIMCGTIYFIWAFIFTAIFILMLFMRMNKGFKHTGEAHVVIGGEKI